MRQKSHTNLPDSFFFLSSYANGLLASRVGNEQARTVDDDKEDNTCRNELETFYGVR